jgi:hypothetical protein
MDRKNTKEDLKAAFSDAELAAMQEKYMDKDLPPDLKFYRKFFRMRLEEMRRDREEEERKAKNKSKGE